MISVDQIIEAYKRGLEDGRRGSVQQQGVFCDEWLRLQRGVIYPPDSTGKRPDMGKITCGGNDKGILRQ